MSGVDVTPKRIQRQRTKGWSMPERAVFVGRPTRWGNPFMVRKTPSWPRWAGVAPFDVVTPDDRIWEWPAGDEPPRKAVVFNVAPDYIDGSTYLKSQASRLAVHLFRLHVGPMGSYEYDDDTLTALVADLGGRDLACWCPLDQPCHADVLLEYANTTTEARP